MVFVHPWFCLVLFFSFLSLWLSVLFLKFHRFLWEDYEPGVLREWTTILEESLYKNFPRKDGFPNKSTYLIHQLWDIYLWPINKCSEFFNTIQLLWFINTFKFLLIQVSIAENAVNVQIFQFLVVIISSRKFVYRTSSLIYKIRSSFLLTQPSNFTSKSLLEKPIQVKPSTFWYHPCSTIQYITWFSSLHLPHLFYIIRTTKWNSTFTTFHPHLSSIECL